MNNIHLIEPNKQYIETIKKKLASHYWIKDLRLSSNYLELKITQNWENRTLTISQKKYINSVLAAHRIMNCSFIFIFMKAEMVLRKAEVEHESMQKFKMNYQSMLGLIMYIML